MVQRGVRRMVRRYQVYVLLTDRRHAFHGGRHVFWKLVLAVEPHVRFDAVIGQRHRLDSPDRHAAVGDVRVLVESATGDEVRGDVVRTESEARGDMKIEDGDRADTDHRDEREDCQLNARQSIQHQLGGTSWPDAVPGGILNGSAACPFRFAYEPTSQSGGFTTSLRCFMLGSKYDVVKMVSPRRRIVRSNVTNTFR